MSVVRGGGEETALSGEGLVLEGFRQPLSRPHVPPPQGFVEAVVDLLALPLVRHLDRLVDESRLRARPTAKY